MTNRGRPRDRNAKRFPCGKVDHSGETPVGELARARHAYLRKLADPLWATELGILQLEGRITAMQRLAGEAYSAAVEAHRRIGLDGPNGRPKVSQMEPHIPGGTEKEYDRSLIYSIEEQYDRLFTAMIDIGREGVSIVKAVNRLCVEDKLLSYPERALAKRGLDSLVRILKLDIQPKT